MHGVVPPQPQGFVIPFAEVYEAPLSLFLQPDKVPLGGSMAFWCINHSSHFCVISKVAKGKLCPITQIVNECVKQDQTSY